MDGLPQFGTLTDHGDSTGLLEFRPRCGDADAYLMTLTASNAEEHSISEDFTLTVTPDPACAQVGGNARFQRGGEDFSGRSWLGVASALATAMLLLLAGWYVRWRWLGMGS